MLQRFLLLFSLFLDTKDDIYSGHIVIYMDPRSLLIFTPLGDWCVVGSSWCHFLCVFKTVLYPRESRRLLHSIEGHALPFSHR